MTWATQAKIYLQSFSLVTCRCAHKGSKVCVEEGGTKEAFLHLEVSLSCLNREFLCLRPRGGPWSPLTCLPTPAWWVTAQRLEAEGWCSPKPETKAKAWAYGKQYFLLSNRNVGTENVFILFLFYLCVCVCPPMRACPCAPWTWGGQRTT